MASNKLNKIARNIKKLAEGLYTLTDIGELVDEWYKKYTDPTRPNGLFFRFPDLVKKLIHQAIEQSPFTTKEMRLLKKTIKERMKNVGQYGGVPEKIDAEKRLLREIVENIDYELKHPNK